MNQLIAYHGDPAIKDKYLARVRRHRAEDQLVKGQYWKDGKGCAVGCTIHGGEHRRYETELGIPIQLARIEDGLFEALPNGEAQAWPEAFLDAIPVGANLYIPYWQFMRWLLIDPEEGVIRFAKREKTKQAIENVGALYGRLLDGGTVSEEEWRNARAYAAADAAAYAAYAAAYAAAAAAYAAAYAADAAAAYAAAYAARTKARVRQSEKLLELLRAAPCVSDNGVELAAQR
jgi:hypothetical protein